MRLRVSLRCLLSFLMVLAVTAMTVRAEESDSLSAEQLIALYSKSYKSITSAEATYSYYVRKMADECARKSPEGWDLLYQHEWGWENQPQKEYSRGEFARARTVDGKWIVQYHQTAYANNGKELRTQSLVDQYGRLEKSPQTEFYKHGGPLELIGKRLGSAPIRDLPELLKGATLVEKLPDGIYLLEGEFKETETYKLKVWLSSQYGYLPVKIKTYNVRTNNTIWKEIEVTRFKKMEGGVWFPVQGNVTFYFTSENFTLPDNLTAEEVIKMSPEEKEEVRKRTIFRSVPMGHGTAFYTLDEKTLKVNQPIDDSRFEFEFAKGILVFDTINNQEYKVE